MLVLPLLTIAVCIGLEVSFPWDISLVGGFYEMWLTPKVEKEREVIIAFRPGDRISAVITGPDCNKTFSLAIQACTANEIKINLPADSTNELTSTHSQNKIQILKPVGEHLIYTEGTSFSLSQESKSTLIVQHNNTALVSDRRAFQRIGMRKRIRLIPVSDSGKQIDAPRMVSVTDISATGIGIKTRKKFSLKTCFRTHGLFITPEHDETCADYLYQLVWRRGNPWLGYRYGAVFTFSSPEDIRRLSSVLEKLQLMNLTQEYQQLLAALSK
jgi:hypothetical protein